MQIGVSTFFLWHLSIDNSLKQLIFLILVGYDFTLVRYAGKRELYFSIEYCTIIADARASEIQKMQRSSYFVKTGLFQQKSCESEVSIKNLGRRGRNTMQCNEPCNISHDIHTFHWAPLFNFNATTAIGSLHTVCQCLNASLWIVDTLYHRKLWNKVKQSLI